MYGVNVLEVLRGAIKKVKYLVEHITAIGETIIALKSKYGKKRNKSDIEYWSKLGGRLYQMALAKIADNELAFAMEDRKAGEIFAT